MDLIMDPRAVVFNPSQMAGSIARKLGLEYEDVQKLMAYEPDADVPPEDYDTFRRIRQELDVRTTAKDMGVLINDCPDLQLVGGGALIQQARFMRVGSDWLLAAATVAMITRMVEVLETPIKLPGIRKDEASLARSKDRYSERDREIRRPRLTPFDPKERQAAKQLATA